MGRIDRRAKEEGRNIIGLQGYPDNKKRQIILSKIKSINSNFKDAKEYINQYYKYYADTIIFNEILNESGEGSTSFVDGYYDLVLKEAFSLSEIQNSKINKFNTTAELGDYDMLSSPEATGAAADEVSESEGSVNNSFQGGYSKLAPSLYFCNTLVKIFFSFR